MLWFLNTYRQNTGTDTSIHLKALKVQCHSFCSSAAIIGSHIRTGRGWSVWTQMAKAPDAGRATQTPCGSVPHGAAGSLQEPQAQVIREGCANKPLASNILPSYTLVFLCIELEKACLCQPNLFFFFYLVQRVPLGTLCSDDFDTGYKILKKS